MPSPLPDRRIGLYALIVGISICLMAAATAGAATPPSLWQAPEDGLAGSGSGQLRNPSGIAANPSTGDLYVAEAGNLRVSQFTAWGQFVRAWGWGVRDGAAEFQICGPGEEPQSSCQAGIAGDGSGQFEIGSGAVAVDPETGDVYVGDMQNNRMQKFDEDGNFLLMFGGGVNETTGEDVCTAASGDSCGAGVKGVGDGEFQLLSTDPASVALGKDSPPTVYVSDRSNRIQWFEPDGDFKGKTTLSGALAGKSVTGLAVDASERLYLTGSPDNDLSPLDNIYRYTLAGEEEVEARLAARDASAVTVNEAGNVYAIIRRETFSPKEIIAYTPAGTPIIAAGEGFAAPGQPSGSGAPPVGLAGVAVNPVTGTGEIDVYTIATSPPDVGVGYVAAYGPPPDLWPPPLLPPRILSQFATSVDQTGATVKAQINPRYWADTGYYVEYGTGKCSEGGCTATQPAPPGTQLGAGAVGSGVTTKPVILSGLQPGTTYHYRFVAESTGGGPVKGVGEGEEERTFTTRVPLPEDLDCPNRALRTGAGARLPDCRAYELVSPLDKNGTDIKPLINIFTEFVAYNRAAVEGGKLTYTTSQGFGDTQGVPYLSQYIATRGPDGWSNHGISPPQGLSTAEPATRAEVEFRAFTPDLCAAVHLDATEPLLAPGAVPGFPNLYRRQNCGEEGYQALTTTAPPNLTPTVFMQKMDVQGVSDGAECTVFRLNDQLTPEANPGQGGELPGSNSQVYESCGGTLRLVSLQPDGTPSTSDSAAGTSPQAGKVRTSSVANALSADGSRVYWSDADRLYLRVNSTQAQSKVVAGVCTQAAKGCTYPVSKDEAFFWAAAEDGSNALYTEGKDLYRFDAGSKASTLLAGEVEGLAGASADASRYYFVSREALASGAGAGEPNLYLGEEGQSPTFIATLTEGEADRSLKKGLTPIAAQPYQRDSRVSPDGRHLVFTSAAPITAYDNAEALSGEPMAEVYRFDAEAGELHCVSCNPTGSRPRGQGVLIEGFPSKATLAAAYVPGYQSQLYGSRAVTDDGTRVYFNSFDALIAGDTNGRLDVYQWEAPGAGSCTESSPAYGELNGGCLALISSGESAADSEFVDASPDGSDVFFATASSLVGQDPGLIDIYDARVEGGYPPPPSPPTICEGEACQGLPSAPSALAPASAFFQGAGNVKEGATRKPRCPKGKHRRKGRCVKKNAHKKKPKNAAKREGSR